jgi:signal transduction histidine kinase
MKVIKQNAVRLSKIVEQVTMLHDIREGRLTWHPTSLDTLIQTIVDFQKLDAVQHGCTLKVKMESNIPLVDGDALYLGRAVEALLDNAIKFSPQGGAIEIRTWTEDNRVLITVQDHGIGISEEQRSRLFKCFSQIDGSAARRFGGIGTGLALVKEVVQAHGGEIWLESEPGKGSTFGFWVPVQRLVQPSTSQGKVFL